jgi:uncharacterized protein (TIGR03086 family)
MDVLDLFERGTAWTATKIAGATDDLDAPTNCDGWDIRRMIDHMLAGQQMFAAAATGGEFAPPSDPPPALTGDDPAAQYEDARKATAHAFGQPGVLESTFGRLPAAQAIGIAFCDNLIHGWDLARSTGQDATMPDDLAVAAYAMLHGNIPDDRRGSGLFKPAVSVPDAACTQDKLVAYCGRDPR